MKNGKKLRMRNSFSRSGPARARKKNKKIKNNNKAASLQA